MSIVNNTSCSFDGDVLSYLYDEATDAERLQFEEHLENCEACVEELALLSDSRYSVYEWRMIEFVPMMTPEIVIPVAVPSRLESLIQTLMTVFAFPRGLVAAGAGFAVLSIAGIFGFLLMSSNLPSDDVVQVTNSKPMVTPTQVTSVNKRSEDVSSNPGADATNVVPKVSIPLAGERKPATVKTAVSAPQSQNTRGRSSRTQNRSVPTLSSYDDDEDKSLRLADLFDDLDTRDLE